MAKSIIISDELWTKLMMIKAQKVFKSMSDVIIYLLDEKNKQEKKR